MVMFAPTLERNDPPMVSADGHKNAEYAAEIGGRIVMARKEQNLTQVELAELIGVSQRSMQAYENGEVIPYRKMRDIARVLEKPLEYFLHGQIALASEERLEAIESSLEKMATALDRLSKAIAAKKTK